MTTPTPSEPPTGAVKRENGELELTDGKRSTEERTRARRLEQHSTQSVAPTDDAAVHPATGAEAPGAAGS